MKSQREIVKKYQALLSRVAKDDYYKIDLANRVNCYVCSCGHITKTRDIDPGVTPAMHQCESCEKLAHSTFYRDVAPTVKPTQEWYRPTLDECLKSKKSEALLDHIFKGGLLCRPIKETPPEKHFSQIAS